MKTLNRQQRNNRANQLNPNNIQYYKSRVDMSKYNTNKGYKSNDSYMPKKHRQSKEVKLPDGTYRSDTNDDYG